MAAPDFLVNTPTVDEKATLLLAHGAGAAMDSPFMNDISELLSARGVRVLRFEFPYMVKRRESGTKRPPDRMPVLQNSWRAAVKAAGDPARLAIGGKSMGGRVASMLADELAIRRLICLGYPFYAPGRVDKPRVEHLASLATPALFCQGERDTMGNHDEVSSYALSSAIRVEWLADGDHSLKPRRKSGHTLEGNLSRAADLVSEFLCS
ncbi:MAG: alpha/beta fold hydrolase [Rhodospirillaceae bacterium]|nr:alpha/beta fold hydrolase [Rhodospirillaceae bacterium]